jgi:hypothetical protein
MYSPHFACNCSMRKRVCLYILLRQYVRETNGASIMSIPEGDVLEPDVIDVDTLDDIVEGDEDDTCIYVTPSEVAQAFSHFSYYQSGGKIILVDLQGEYNRQQKRFYFTDPVIHYYNKHNPGRKTLYGRTDMGRKGMNKFFETHTCNALCELTTRGFKTAREPCTRVTDERSNKRQRT